MENFFEEDKKRKINTKKVILFAIILIFIISIIVISIMYCNHRRFRNWIDINILRKEINHKDTVSIELSGENTKSIYAFDKYIVILENKTLKIYDAVGTEVATISTQINNPIFDTAGKYLIVADENGENIYLLLGKKLLWESKVEGKISGVHVNENGYVGIIISDISYKNIVDIYDLTGKSVFKTYIATNNVIDIGISKNNEYLAIAEVDIAGVIIQSNIRIISIEKAKTDPLNAIVNVYNADSGKIIINIEYQKKDRLVCFYNDSIDVIENSKKTELINLKNNKTAFASIELKNNIAIIEERQVKDYTSDSYVIIKNIINNKDRLYISEQIAKEIYTYENILALNFGTELHVINSNGWLMKKYISDQEINQVVMSDKIIGIIYRDRIEIIEL